MSNVAFLDICFHSGSLVTGHVQQAGVLVICASDHVVLIFVFYVEVYVIDKTWCEYEPNKTTDNHNAVNPGLITSKTPVNNGCIKIVVTRSSTKLQTMLIMSCCQFQQPE